MIVFEYVRCSTCTAVGNYSCLQVKAMFLHDKKFSAYCKVLISLFEFDIYVANFPDNQA